MAGLSEFFACFFFFLVNIQGSISPFLPYACVTGGLGEDHPWPCADLGVALEGLTRYNHSTVRVAAGNYSLNNSGEDAAGHYQYLWMVGVAIVAKPKIKRGPGGRGYHVRGLSQIVFPTVSVIMTLSPDPPPPPPLSVTAILPH